MSNHDIVTGTAHGVVASVGAYISNASPDEFVSFIAGLLTCVYMLIMITNNLPKFCETVKRWKRKLLSWRKE